MQFIMPFAIPFLSIILIVIVGILYVFLYENQNSTFKSQIYIFMTLTILIGLDASFIFRIVQYCKNPTLISTYQTISVKTNMNYVTTITNECKSYRFISQDECHPINTVVKFYKLDYYDQISTGLNSELTGNNQLGDIPTHE